MEIKEFTPEIESLFAQFLYSDPETFVRVKNIVRHTFFDDPDQREAVRFMLEYTDKHNSMPTREQIRAVSGVDIDAITDINADHVNWFMGNMERFCQQKAAREAVHKSIDLIRDNRLGEVVEALKAAAELGIVRDLGTDYFADPEARLTRMRERNNMVSSGWKHIDEKLYGGLNRGDITIFAGRSGSGKSLFLQNLALNWAQLGLNVVYISLELSEELCSMRLDSMTTGYGQKEIMKNMSDVALKVGAFRKTCRGETGQLGTLQVKQLKSGVTTNDIRAYLKEYETQSKLKVDAIVVDYLDLCMPYSVKVSPSDQFTKDKYVSEELRNLAVERNCLMSTASQLNRCLTLDTIVVERKKGPVRIDDIKAGDEISSDQGYNTVLRVFPVKTQPVYEIVTRSGKKIRCSAEHVFPTPNGGVNKISSGLGVGDKLIVKVAK